MKQTAISIGLITALLTGCTAAPIPLTPGAKQVTAITSPDDTDGFQCKIVGTHTIVDGESENIVHELKNATYAQKGDRYKVVKILSGDEDEPSGVVAELYRCRLPALAAKSLDTRDIIPGAEAVEPISFAEIENNQCHILGSTRIEQASQATLKKDLANKTYMMGGNRYHVTQMSPSHQGQKGIINADVYG